MCCSSFSKLSLSRLAASSSYSNLLFGVELHSEVFFVVVDRESSLKGSKYRNSSPSAEALLRREEGGVEEEGGVDGEDLLLFGDFVVFDIVPSLLRGRAEGGEKEGGEEEMEGRGFPFFGDFVFSFEDVKGDSSRKSSSSSSGGLFFVFELQVVDNKGFSSTSSSSILLGFLLLFSFPPAPPCLPFMVPSS